jgi:putative endonuclease
LVTRRYKTRRGEIDLIALDGDQLVFVEVKFRRAKGYLPEASVGRGKVKALIEAAELYLLANEFQPKSYRFDLIAIDSNGLRHHIDLLKP